MQKHQKQTRPSLNAGLSQSQFQSIKQIKSQTNQMQKHIKRIQNDVQRIRMASVTGTRQGTKTKVRKRDSSTSIKSRPKKTKSSRSIKSQKRKRMTRNRLKQI